MTAQELAAKLDGREVGNEITREETAQAKKDGLLVVYGGSDDLIELDGAIHDEVNAYDGGECYIKNGKLLEPLEDESDIEVLEKYGVLEIVQTMHKDAIKIEALWCPDGSLYSWVMRAEGVEWHSFDVNEGGGKFCRGMVIQL